MAIITEHFEVSGRDFIRTYSDRGMMIHGGVPESDYEEATDDEMYDKRNIEIERQLNDIYGIDNFNYSVWYKNGLHNVYVYSNGNSYEYEYFEENDKIRLEKIEIKRRKSL